jgi:hypothetical protein
MMKNYFSGQVVRSESSQFLSVASDGDKATGKQCGHKYLAAVCIGKAFTV